jgi:hypothetical protein
MAKYSAVDETTKKIFMDAIEQAQLTQYIKFDVVNDSKAKKIHDVKKTSEQTKYYSDKDVDMIIFINEDIFWQLEDDQQVMVAKESIAGISYDSEKDVIKVEKPDRVTYSGLLRQVGYEKYNVLQESIKTLYQVKENKGEESSEAQKAEA